MSHQRSLVSWNPFGHVSLYCIRHRPDVNVCRGGGNVLNNNLDRRHPAFLWMSYEAVSAGLFLNVPDMEWKWNELGQVHESLTSVWKLFEYLPFKRPTYENSGSHTWR
jgi:hypothetical protein